MAIIKSGATSDQWTIDPTSKSGRVSLYDDAGRSVLPQTKQTFYASGTFTPAATPTDLITIFGSATKTVRIVSFEVETTNTAAGSQQFFLIKRSSANAGGTFVTATAVASDSNDSASATAGHYTANATALGTTVGTIRTVRIASPVAVPGSFAGVSIIAGADLLELGSGANLQKPIVLRGTAQGLCLNFAGAALVAGQTHAYTIVWTEE